MACESIESVSGLFPDHLDSLTQGQGQYSWWSIFKSFSFKHCKIHAIAFSPKRSKSAIMQMWLIHETGFCLFFKNITWGCSWKTQKLHCPSQAETDWCGSFRDLPADRLMQTSAWNCLVWKSFCCELTVRSLEGSRRAWVEYQVSHRWQSLLLLPDVQYTLWN